MVSRRHRTRSARSVRQREATTRRAVATRRKSTNQEKRSGSSGQVQVNLPAPDYCSCSFRFVPFCGRKDLIMMRGYLRLTLIVIVSLGSAPAVLSQSTDTSDPLVRVLQAKGILTESEASAITSNASPTEQRDRLAALLRDKGVISATEFEAVRAPSSLPEVKTITAEYKTTAPAPLTPEPQATPAVIAAVAPVRLQGIDV